MRTSYLAAGLVAGLSALAEASPTRYYARRNDTRPSGDNNACAAAAKLWADDQPANPSGRVPPTFIPSKVALDCLMSVPFDADIALNLTKSLKPYFQLQSTTDYLMQPPEGYLYDAINLPAELDAIEDRISKKEYTSEYQFQADIQAVIISAKDQHFGFNGDIFSVFAWVRQNFAVAAVSKDGKEVPKIYNLRDVVEIGTDGARAVSMDDASEIVEVNGLKVADFINAEAYALTGQDPDGNWNTMAFTLQGASNGFGSLAVPPFYPGPTTEVTYANGTKESYKTMAAILQSLEGVTSGKDMFNKFVIKHEVKPITRRSAEPFEVSAEHAQLVKRQTSETQKVPFYPEPEFIDGAGVVSGYFLGGKANQDVAVLAISSFVPGTSLRISDAALESFQKTIEDFLAHAKKNRKTKLIVDLQGNGGGAVNLALDTYMQLFPKSDGPNSKNNLRASIGMEAFVKTASAEVAAAEKDSDPNEAILTEFVLSPLSFQSVMTPDEKNFKDANEFYGPVKIGNGMFTNFQQPNWTNTEPDQVGIPGIVITGTNNRTDFTQPFKAENIVVLTDSKCASACTILAEMLKNFQGVRTVALGGRPQTGPVQAIGGVKGSQLFPDSEFRQMLELAPFMTAETNATLVDTVFEDFNDYPLIRGTDVKVNGRNAYRIGDASQTCLHFVYEAADCRLYYTQNMTVDATAIWRKTARAMFPKNGTVNNDLCVADSTGHPTSVTGGVKKGELGPQTPPQNAKAALGWLVNGTDIVRGSPVGMFTGKVQDRVGLEGKFNDSNASDNKNGTSNGNNEGLSADQVKSLAQLQSACSAYSGKSWLVSLVCASL